jgi:hypothetical protein
MKLNYSELCPGMVIGTTNLFSPLAAIIRATTAGIKNIFNKKISSHIVIVCEEHDLLYGMEMAWPKIRQIDLNDIEKHIVFIAKDSALVDEDLQWKCNHWLLTSHYIGVRYDWKELFRFWNIQTYDDKKKWICSDLYREMLKYNGMNYPKEWNNKCDPYDIQRYYK